MAINFFLEECKSKTKEKAFGIWDAPPATLAFENPEGWDVNIENKNEIEITHIAVDGCLDIPVSEGERCDSLLTYEDAILFVEIKDREGGRWAGKARDQLKNTIKIFEENTTGADYRKKYAYIANKQRPHFNSGGKSFSQLFEDETGYILRVSNLIRIE